MKTRVKTAIAALIIFIPLLLLGGNYFKIVCAALTIMSIYEIVKMTFNKSDIFITGISSLIPIIYFLFDKDLSYNKLLLYFLVMILLLLFVVITKHEIKIMQIGTIIFLIIYLIIGFYSLYLLREISITMILYLLFTIWATDSFAYIGGIKFGRRKLAPAISPNKSIEGSIIGSASSIIIAIIFFLLTDIFSNIFSAIIITIVVSIVGQFGDLIESAYKRECGVKDSSNLLPGHGGIFDRFDSVILAAPCLILLLSL